VKFSVAGGRNPIGNTSIYIEGYNFTRYLNSPNISVFKDPNNSSYYAEGIMDHLSQANGVREIRIMNLTQNITFSTRQTISFEAPFVL